MKALSLAFIKVYQKEEQVQCFAPGRVNLIGEHIDYNGGYVLPYAIPLGVSCAASRRNDRMIQLYSCQYPADGIVTYHLDDLTLKGSWADYPVSVIKVLLSLGYAVDEGVQLMFDSSLPVGAGLSSSAAIEVAVLSALKELFSLSITNKQAALICQWAENRFMGVNSGIMDPFVSVLGQKNSAVLLHTDTLDYRYIPLGDVAVVIVNSGVKHSLAASAYNQRRQECMQAAKDLGVSSLCSLTPEAFEQKKHLITNPVSLKRAYHAVYENDRTIRAAKALEQQDWLSFGQLMTASHISLRDAFEVSCEELDFLAEQALHWPGVYGARLTGGGFGGCTVNLMAPSAAESFSAALGQWYEQRFGFRPAVYICAAGQPV